MAEPKQRQPLSLDDTDDDTPTLDTSAFVPTNAPSGPSAKELRTVSSAAGFPERLTQPATDASAEHAAPRRGRGRRKSSPYTKALNVGVRPELYELVWALSEAMSAHGKDVILAEVMEEAMLALGIRPELASQANVNHWLTELRKARGEGE